MMISKTSEPGFSVIGIEHVAVALNGSENIKFFLNILPGVSFKGTERITDQKVDTEIFSTSRGKIELLSPVSKDSPISSFLEKRGEGIHHIALEVDHIENTIKYLKSNGFHMIDDIPRLGAEGYKIAFVHPKSTPGLLMEFCQKR
ncbi:MAG: methylmalonyl-CoA epimerase [Fidelibacterota bacterium]